MRRQDREIKEFQEILSVMEHCDVCRIAMFDGEYPYLVPLNFGMETAGSRVTLYFHAANKGKKLELLRSNPRVCFEMDCNHQLHFDNRNGMCTMAYESVIGYGTILFLEEEKEKIHGLDLLTAHYHPKDNFYYNRAAVAYTEVFLLEVISFTGKHRELKKEST